LRQQRQHVGGIDRNLVAQRVFQPVALATTDDVRTDHTQRLFGTHTQGLGQRVEVTPLARQTVHANHHMRGLGAAPLPIGHAVPALGIGAIYVIQRRLKHDEIADQIMSTS
jgi:hypothetical protein